MQVFKRQPGRLIIRDNTQALLMHFDKVSRGWSMGLKHGLEGGQCWLCSMHEETPPIEEAIQEWREITCWQFTGQAQDRIVPLEHTQVAHKELSWQTVKQQPQLPTPQHHHMLGHGPFWQRCHNHRKKRYFPRRTSITRSSWILTLTSLQPCNVGSCWK